MCDINSGALSGTSGRPIVFDSLERMLLLMLDLAHFEGAGHRQSSANLVRDL